MNKATKTQNYQYKQNPSINDQDKVYWSEIARTMRISDDPQERSDAAKKMGQRGGEHSQAVCKTNSNESDRNNPKREDSKKDDSKKDDSKKYDPNKENLMKNDYAKGDVNKNNSRGSVKYVSSII